MEASPTHCVVSTNHFLHAGYQVADKNFDHYDDGYDRCACFGQLSIAGGEIQANGDTHQLYDGHVHSFPTGHSRYVAMSVDERLKVAILTKLCVAKEPGTVDGAREYEAKNTNVSEFGINFKTPVFDHSPCCYTLGNYVDRIISKHRGFEICWRYSLYVCPRFWE